MTRANNLKMWVALLVAALSAAVVAAIGVALDAGMTVAAPPTNATIEATQFRVASGQSGEGSAVCPGTKRAVGGGVVQSGPALPGMRLIASGPLDSTGVTLETNDGDRAKKWYAAVHNDTSEQRTYRVYAICSGSSTATIEATPLTVQNDGRSAETFAVCPGNRRALGGGVVQSGPTHRDLRVNASGPLDSTGITAETVSGDVAKQWYAAVSNFSTQQRTFKVFAICSGDSSARIKATSSTLTPGQSAEAFARCASTKRALGGGVVQSGPAGSLVVRVSGPLDATGVTLETKDGDVAKQWYTAVLENNGTTREFKVFSICE